MNKFKIGQKVRLNIPKNTFKPFRTGDYSISSVSLASPSRSSYIQMSGNDEFIVLNTNYYNSNLFYLEHISSKSRFMVNEDEILSNSDVIRKKLGVK